MSSGTSKEQPVTIRFRSRIELLKIKRAARLQDVSFNKFVARYTFEAAERVIRDHEVKQQTQSDGTAAD